MSEHSGHTHTHGCKRARSECLSAHTRGGEGVPTDSGVDVLNPKQTPSVSHYKDSALAPRMSTFHKYYLGLAKPAGQKPERRAFLRAASEHN